MRAAALLVLLALGPRPARAQRVETFVAVSVTAGAAALDLAATMSCRSCVEVGAAQLVGGPRQPVLLVLGNVVTVAGVGYLTHELRRDHKPLWWLPALLVTTAYVYSWRHNLGAQR